MRNLVLAAAALLLAACGAEAAGPQAMPAPVPEPAVDGWRWESYRGIELQVPADYGWQTTGSPLYPAWCASGGPDGPPGPGVNRVADMVVPAIACLDGRPSETLAAAVDLDSSITPGTVEHTGGWVSETVEVRGVSITVSDDDPARRARILRSVREVQDVDAHGCALDSDLRAPEARPDTGPLPDPDDVTTVAVCRYHLGDETSGAPPVLSSSGLAGADAAALVRAVLAAPDGGGPDSPGECAEQVARGDEMVVLHVRTADGVHDVAVRYAGCVGHATDDGTTVRALTAEVLRAVLAGPHRPTVLHGDVATLLHG